jgi:hypothetical protein
MADMAILTGNCRVLTTISCYIRRRARMTLNTIGVGELLLCRWLLSSRNRSDTEKYSEETDQTYEDQHPYTLFTFHLSLLTFRYIVIR